MDGRGEGGGRAPHQRGGACRKQELVKHLLSKEHSGWTDGWTDGGRGGRKQGRAPGVTRVEEKLSPILAHCITSKKRTEADTAK